MRRKAAEAAVGAAAAVEPVAVSSSGDAGPAPARSRSSQTWAMLIKRLYEIDPLTMRLTAPKVQRTETVHVVLEVQDRGKPCLWAYRRAIITIKP